MRTVSRIAVVSLALAPITTWAATPVDVGNASITCATVIATAKLKPASTIGGPVGPTSTKVKGTVAGCTVTGATATVVSGKFSGTLAGNSSDCLTLAGTQPTTGTLTFKWKADPTTPLLQKSSVVSVVSTTGGTITPGGAFGSTQYAQFSLNSSGVTGAFTGGDGGATSTNTAVSSQDIIEITVKQCGGPKGLKLINIGLGKITLQ